MEKLKELFNKVFRDDTGKVIIGQTPNLPLIVAFVFFVVKYIYPTGTIGNLFNYAYILTFLYWAYLEMVSGVNIFRKLLGLFVALYFLQKILNLLL